MGGDSGDVLALEVDGAGKSTTFNCVTGTYPPTDGTVYFKGEDVTGISASTW